MKGELLALFETGDGTRALAFRTKTIRRRRIVWSRPHRPMGPGSGAGLMRVRRLPFLERLIEGGSITVCDCGFCKHANEPHDCGWIASVTADRDEPLSNFDQESGYSERRLFLFACVRVYCVLRGFCTYSQVGINLPSYRLKLDLQATYG